MILDGKTAMITGAARGIGAALAKGLAAAGADIIVADMPGQDEAKALVKANVEDAGRRCTFVEIDVTNKTKVEAAIAEATASAGQINVFVNNAGILDATRLEDLDEASWDAHFDVNAKGVLLCTNAVLPQMRARKSGRIINIASLAARQGIATEGHYAATKASVVTLTRVYAQEVGADGISVNAICPGIILTEMAMNKLGSQEEVDKWSASTALGRLGNPSDVVGPAVFFASDLADYVTGQALNVCGGLYFH